MTSKREARLREDLRSAVAAILSWSDDPVVRFSLKDFAEEDFSIRFVVIIEKSSVEMEYSIFCCREEYPRNTLVSSPLEPDDMTSIDAPVTDLLQLLREIAADATLPPAPSAILRRIALRRSSSDVGTELRQDRKQRSTSHPGPLQVSTSLDYMRMETSFNKSDSEEMALGEEDVLDDDENSEDEGEEGYASSYGEPVDDEFMVPLEDTVNPLLVQDINIMREWWGTESINFKVFESLDEIELDLNVDVSFLDEETAMAWSVSRRHPIVVQLHLSLSRYLDGKKPVIKVKQTDSKEKFGLGLQLQKILEAFISMQWEQLSNSLVEKECVWKPKSKSLLLPDFCADHSRSESKDDESGEIHADSGYCVDQSSAASVADDGDFLELDNASASETKLSFKTGPADLLDMFVSQLVDMGFEREQSFNALQVCSNYRLHEVDTQEFNSLVEKALNYLLGETTGNTPLCGSRLEEFKRTSMVSIKGKDLSTPGDAANDSASDSMAEGSRVFGTDNPLPRLPHSPALPSISAHSTCSPPSISPPPISPPPNRCLTGPLAASTPFDDGNPPAAPAPEPPAEPPTVGLSEPPSEPLEPLQPRTCFASLPSFEKSRSTQALVRVSETSALVQTSSIVRKFDQLMSSPAGSSPLCDGELEARSSPVVKGTRSASCSNVPEKSVSQPELTEENSAATEAKSVLLSTTSSALSSYKLSSSSPPPVVSLDPSASLVKEHPPTSSSAASPSSSLRDNFAFSFKPSAVIKKFPAVFQKAGGSPGRKRSAMKPTPSQHKALAELASNGELQLLPCNTLNGTQSKVIPKLIRGFLAQTYQYARQRIPTLNEFCVVCDRSHLFQNGSCMMKPAVCARELCVFAFSNLNVMGEAADSISTAAEVVDLLIAMAKAACRSTRKTLIFDPFPIVVDPDSPSELAFNPKRPDFARALSAMEMFPLMKRMTSLVGGALKREMDAADKLGYPLLNWIISSNRSHIVKLPPDKQLDFMHTKHQFLLLCSPPAKETAFRGLKREHGSTFAFHGSNFENWHSILRNGLYNASGTKHQLHGAAYGSGIYLSPVASVSFGYSGMGHGHHAVKALTKTQSKPASSNTAPPPHGASLSKTVKTTALPTGRGAPKRSSSSAPPIPNKGITAVSFKSSANPHEFSVSVTTLFNTSVRSSVPINLAKGTTSTPSPILSSVAKPPKAPSASSGLKTILSKIPAACSAAASVHVASDKCAGGTTSAGSSTVTRKQHFLLSNNLSCIALCEVITSPELKRNGNIWVCPNSDHVCTRFFFVYEDGQVGDANIDTQLPKYESKILDAIAGLMKDLRHCNEPVAGSNL